MKKQKDYLSIVTQENCHPKNCHPKYCYSGKLPSKNTKKLHCNQTNSCAKPWLANHNVAQVGAIPVNFNHELVVS